jgi:hypothetical protein
MCNRLQRGKYGQASELALIACKYNLEIIVLENGTQEWIQKSTGTHQQRHIIALRWCRETIHYDWLKRINSDEPKRANHPPVSLTLGPHVTDADNLPPPTWQESNRARQLKNKLGRCLISGDDVEMDSPATSAKCNQVLHRPGFPEFGLNSRDADNPPPSAPKESYGSRQSQHNSSRCSSSGNKGTIDSSSDSDEFSEKVIYSQDSPKVVDITTDFDWELDRFVEFKSPFTRKEILSPGNNSSHWNKNNSSVMIDNHQRRNEIKKLKNQVKPSR